MKLSVVLVLGLAAGAFAAAASKEDVHLSNNRRPRVFFAEIGSRIASWVGLGEKSVTVSKSKPIATKIVYVNKADTTKACEKAFSDKDCPGGHVCSLAHTCVPKSGLGAYCFTRDQCLAGECHEYRCVKNSCQKPGEQSNCPAGETCVSTDNGNACRPKDNTCFTSFECGDDQYCRRDGRCVGKLQMNAVCTKDSECQHSVCRNHRCKNDVCPAIDKTEGCPLTEHCTSSPNGNVCRPKRENSESCSTKYQCKSDRCEKNKCVHHECPVKFSSAHCPRGLHCLPGEYGNVCGQKRDRGENCNMNRECKSGHCDRGHCFEDHCPLPQSSHGCPMTQVCVKTPNGNTCMTGQM